MKKFNNKSGFTLIEIIVVLIIIGILAAVALPNLFQNVTTSKASTVLAVADSYKTQVEGCIMRGSGAGSLAGPNAGGAACSLITLGVLTALPNGFILDIPAAGTGTVGAGTVAYKITGSDGNGSLAFTLARTQNGTWSCTANSVPPYNNVC